MQGFNTYKSYLYIKRHFKDIKFIWSEEKQYKVKEETFDKRRDKPFFLSLESKFSSQREVNEYFISCFLHNQNAWIGDLMDERFKEVHSTRMKRVSSLDSQFKRDYDSIEFLLYDRSISLDEALSCRATTNPLLLGLYPNEISLETLAIIEFFSHFTNLWFPINPLLKERRKVIYKYSMVLFLNDKGLSSFQDTYTKLANFRTIQ